MGKFGRMYIYTLNKLPIQTKIKNKYLATRVILVKKYFP